MEKAIIGKKIGMTQIFDADGKVIPVTVIEAGPCTVVQKKTEEKDGYTAVQLGYEDVAERKLTKPELGHLKKAGDARKKTLKEFKLAKAAEMNVGDEVNVERSMMMNGRLDGHIVQGHVDQTAVCTSVEDANGSWYYTFEYPFDQEMAQQGYITVEKGSVCVNGVSLTVCNSKQNSFQVAIIPYTHDNTNFCQIEKGTVVNLEFDIVGKYISKMMQFK